MVMADKFQLKDEGTPPRKTTAPEPSPEQAETAAAVSVPNTKRAIDKEPIGNDVDASGIQLAFGVDAAGYHPVVLFGNANSGKTSLLLSLFALLRTEPQLDTGLELGDPIIPVDSLYGEYLSDQAEGFFGRKTQDFIEGRASPKTAIELPFFIPVVFRPEGKPEIRFAFMESNGEWYRPDRSSEKLFPKLRRQIEDFLATYQGPITFIHLLPYTQQAVYVGTGDKLTDEFEMREASLAIAGALYAYQKARVNKQDDRHLVLVTKWDAHDRQELNRADVLQHTGNEAADFANERYAQAMAVFRGLGLQGHQQKLNAYCSGIMAGQNVTMPKRDDELREAVLNYPMQLWRWLYRSTLEQLSEQPVDPFPAAPRPHWFLRFLDRFF